MTQTNVLIIGAGEIGKAIGDIIKKNDKSDVKFWDSDPSKVPGGAELEVLASEADVVFLAVPSKAIRQVLEKIGDKIKQDVPVVALAKGIEFSTGKTIDEVMREFLHKTQIALLYGPMIAEELVAGLSSGAVLACKSAVNAKKIAFLFDGNSLRLYYSTDVRGVALVGVLKNIYAIGLGIIHGLNLGSNFRGWYVSQACGEIAKIVKKKRGKVATAYGQAGVGDLVATGFSSESRNHQVGLDLVKDSPEGLKSEGTNSIAHVCEDLRDRKQYTILFALYEIIIEKKAAKNVFSVLIFS